MNYSSLYVQRDDVGLMLSIDRVMKGILTIRIGDIVREWVVPMIWSINIVRLIVHILKKKHEKENNFMQT